MRFISPEWLKAKGYKEFYVIEGEVYTEGSPWCADRVRIHPRMDLWVMNMNHAFGDKLLEQSMAAREREIMLRQEYERKRKERLNKLTVNRAKREEAQIKSKERRVNLPWAVPTELAGAYKLTGFDGLWRQTLTNEKGEVTALHFREPTKHERWTLTTTKIKEIKRGKEKRFIRISEDEIDRFLA